MNTEIETSKPLSVPGWKYQTGAYLGRLIPNRQQRYTKLHEALAECKKWANCNGVTQVVKEMYYELRQGKRFMPSSLGERSWMKSHV